MRSADQTDSESGISGVAQSARAPWSVPALRLIPISDTEGSSFSLSNVDGTSSAS